MGSQTDGKVSLPFGGRNARISVVTKRRKRPLDCSCSRGHSAVFCEHNDPHWMTVTRWQVSP